MTRFGLGGTCGGDNFTSFGAANKATKKYENKSDRGLRRQPDDDFTQQPTKNLQARWKGDHTGCAT